MRADVIAVLKEPLHAISWNPSDAQIPASEERQQCFLPHFRRRAFFADSGFLLELFCSAMDSEGRPSRRCSAYVGQRHSPVSRTCETTGRRCGGNGDSRPIRSDYADFGDSVGQGNLRRRRLNPATCGRNHRQQSKLLGNSGVRTRVSGSPRPIRTSIHGDL